MAIYTRSKAIILPVCLEYDTNWNGIKKIDKIYKKVSSIGLNHLHYLSFEEYFGLLELFYDEKWYKNLV